MNKVFLIEPLELILSVSQVLDMFNPYLFAHHLRVTAVSHALGVQLELPKERLRQLLMAAALHDAGAVSPNDLKGIASFDEVHTGEHSERGYALLRLFPYFHQVAPMVRAHHIRYEDALLLEDRGIQTPFESHILAVADRLSVLSLSNSRERGLSSPFQMVRQGAGARFHPQVVAAMEGLDQEALYASLEAPDLAEKTMAALSFPTKEMGIDCLLELSRFFAHVVDFRDSFTATHSAGVAEVAKRLAAATGLAPWEQEVMFTAGYLHDIGKLSVPVQLLHKPSTLTTSERHVVRAHAYNSYVVLNTVKALSTVMEWGALHHERLDGSGYPFGYGAQDLSHGSRVMAVADVFTACTEDRPYRRGMSVESSLKVLTSLANRGKVDSKIVQALGDTFKDLDTSRAEAQHKAQCVYERFKRESSGHWPVIS